MPDPIKSFQYIKSYDAVFHRMSGEDDNTGDQREGREIQDD